MARPSKPTPPVTPDLVARATPDRDITRPFVSGLVQSPDMILARRGGGDLSIYEQVHDDDQVFSTFQQRRRAVVSRLWEVQPGAGDAQSQAAAAALEADLVDLGWDRVCDQMLFGVFYGFSMAELEWQPGDGRWRLADIHVINRRRIRFDADNRPRLLTPSNMQGELLEPKRFWGFSTGESHSQAPYGLGLAHWCYWPVLFKRQGVRWWSTYLDKFSQPTAVGKFPRGASEAEKAKLLEAVGAVGVDAGIIIPDGMMIELLEAARSGSGDYDRFYARMDAAISKVVLSQTMTTDSGASLSQAKVHEGVKLEVVKADADLLSDSFNAGPAKWFAEWNFPGAAPPRVTRIIEDEEDVNDVAERDTKLYELGWERTPESFMDRYGEGYVRRASIVAPEATPGAHRNASTADQRVAAGQGEPRYANPDASPDASFAAGTGDLVDDMVSAMLTEGGWEEVFSPIVEPAAAALQAATTFEEARGALVQAVADMDVGRLADLLARAGFSIGMAERLDLADD